MKTKKILMGLMVVIMLFITGCNNEKVEESSDATKFSKEYSGVEEDNIFVYKNIEEIIKILENGTGVVYLGFPECKWCVAYVPMLNDVAKKSGVEKINYFDIKEDRENNTDEYQQIVTLLKDHLGYDDEGNHRIYVPAVIVVVNGEIKGFDDETSFDTKGFDEPSEYWTNDAVENLENKLSTMMEELSTNACTSC